MTEPCGTVSDDPLRPSGCHPARDGVGDATTRIGLDWSLSGQHTRPQGPLHITDEEVSGSAEYRVKLEGGEAKNKKGNEQPMSVLRRVWETVGRGD